MARKSNRKNSGFPTSSVTRPGSKGVSQALKQRRYIDIQLKDVLEEMARGTWTDEDDKLWKTTKPYECDECLERSSTRYNNNRHKLNKHSVKKITRCPFPGCKLAFSRSDNLVKHQKKHHPEIEYPTGGDSNDSPEIKELIAEFRRILPSADDLPRNPEPGLGLERYYTYGVLPFLPPELLSHYADYYFASNAFHPLFPLLHKATFKPSSVLASFLRAVCALGGQYDPTNRTLSSQLWESGVKVMERWIERGPVETDEIDVERPRKPNGEEATSKKRPRRDSHYVIPEGIVRPSEPISDYDAVLHPQKQASSRDGYAEKREREGELRVLQGLLLFSIYALFSDEKEKHKKGRNLLARCVEIARDYGYFFEEKERYPYRESSVQHQWERFVYRESRKRVAFTLFLFDCYMVLVFDAPRLLRSTELRNLPLPCDAQLFEASTSQNWHQLWQTNLHGSVNLPSPLFGKTLRALLKGDGHKDLFQAGGLGSNFSALILAAAIHMEILEVTRKLAEKHVELNDDGKPELDQAGDIPRLPDLFAKESHEGLGKLRQALNTLGQVSGIGNLFVLNPGHGVAAYASSEFSLSSNADQIALQPSRLKGCERAFYLSMHLASIQLVIPDRVIICQKEVPMDLETALWNIVDAAKERVFPANASDREAFMRVLDEGDLLPHLLALLRFLAAPNSAYQEVARSTEFPVITVMIFKTLMVVWEVLFRIGEIDNGSVGYNTAENIGMYTLGLESQPGSEDWMLMVDDGMVNWDELLLPPNHESAKQMTVVDKFRHELSGLLAHWEVRHDQQDELESLEWRFLRWMRSVFTDMEHWGVGVAVVNALDRLFEDEEDEDDSEIYEDS